MGPLPVLFIVIISSLVEEGLCAKCMTPDDARYITPVKEIPEDWLNRGWHSGKYFPSPTPATGEFNLQSILLLKTQENGALVWWLKDRETDRYTIISKDQGYLLCTLSGAGLQVGWKAISKEVKRSGYCHWDITVHPEDPSMFQMKNSELRNSIPDIGNVFLNKTGLYFDYGSSSTNDPANRFDDILTWWKWTTHNDEQQDMSSLPDHCEMGASGLPTFMEEFDMRDVLMGRSAGGRRKRRQRFTFTTEDEFAHCANRWYLYGTKCYRIYTAPGMSQYRTKRVCDILKGKIVEPTSVQENTFIRAVIHRHAPGREYWIGLHVESDESSISVDDFRNSMHMPPAFRRWRRQRRLMTNQRCALFTRHGHWKPTNCEVLSGRVMCERDAVVKELPGSSICGKIQDNSVDMLMSGAAVPESDVRIVGGTEAKSTQFPWQAALRFKVAISSKGMKIFHNCGGAVIDNCYVLTAAHCFLANDNKDDYIVRLGDWRKSMDDRTEQEFDIEVLDIHEEYESYPSHRNDIALMKLRKINGMCATFNMFVQPVCLPTRHFSIADEGELCQVSGWGVTDVTKGQRSAAETLQWVSVPTIRNSLCATRYNRNKFNKTYFLPEVMFCAGHKEGGQDSCSGDSGGPYVCRGRSGQYALAGIVSFGIGCARKVYPGVYTRVTHYIPWITEKVREHGDGKIIG